jgi:hypothetical protein
MKKDWKQKNTSDIAHLELISLTRSSGKPFNPTIWKISARTDQHCQDLADMLTQLQLVQGPCFSFKLQACLWDIIYVLLNLIRKILKLSGTNRTYETSIKLHHLTCNFLWSINLPTSAKYAMIYYFSLWCVWLEDRKFDQWPGLRTPNCHE